MNPIGSIQATPNVLELSAARGPQPAAGPSFKDYFADAMRRLQDTSAATQAQAEQAALTLRLAEQVGQRVVATIDEIKQIRV